MKVRIYFNLHRKCLSVQTQTPKGWRVWKHMSEAHLENVTFKVSEAGRQRVLREGKKNVHAYIIGDLVDGKPLTEGETVTYNPYKFSSFVLKDTEAPIHKADKLSIVGRTITISKPKPMTTSTNKPPVIKLSGIFPNTFSVKREQTERQTFMFEWHTEKEENGIRVSLHAAIKLAETFESFGFTQIHKD